MTGFSCELLGMGVMVVLTITLSKRAKYYFKMSVFLVGLTLACGMAIPYMLLKPLHHTNAL
jgi:hypothetical protein